MILVDTNVVVDILGNDPDWESWSSSALDRAFAADNVAINDIIYAELSAGFSTVEQLENALDNLRLALVPLPRGALFLAGQAFRRYRSLGGGKANVLSDFFIGAHAAVSVATLLTRDPGRIRTYFPTVTLICPP
jgi:hypothetical protein